MPKGILIRGMPDIRHQSVIPFFGCNSCWSMPV